MGKIKSRTFTEEFDEQGNLISEWESKEFYPEPKESRSVSIGGTFDPEALRKAVSRSSFEAGPCIVDCGLKASSCGHGSLRS